jgi:hypothetical protein
LAVAVAAAVAACQTTTALQKVEPSSGPVTVSALWMNPDDISGRDLLAGVGGAANAPHTDTFEHVKDESLMSWGFDVKDAEGHHWSVKLGVEAQSEVAVSRLLWAIGYYQPPIYVVDRWTLTGKHAGPQPQGRFRLEHQESKVVDIWSWHDNPFVGTREFGGLIAANVLFNNWDYKAQNNKVYEYKEPIRGQARIYMVRDLGASLGKTRSKADLAWFFGYGELLGTKNNIDDFEKQHFVTGVEGEHVKFDVASSSTERVLLQSVTVQDVHWVCDLLNRLTQNQMLDAFKAGHYDASTSERYVKKIREKIAEGLALAATPATNGREQ